MMLRARLGGSLYTVTRCGPEKLGLRVTPARRFDLWEPSRVLLLHLSRAALFYCILRFA